jgi:hypothetical protein
MNKSDGGKQPEQCDTIIPHTNPDPTKRGLKQKLKNASGGPKGLKSVLEERGFDVRGLQAKCSPVCPFESMGCCMARLFEPTRRFPLSDIDDQGAHQRCWT